MEAIITIEQPQTQLQEPHRPLESQVNNDTVWKFQDFSVSQILREIKLGDSRTAKSAILTHSEGLNFDFYEFLHFLKEEIYQFSHFKGP